jgi:hypothetical protein
LPAYLRSELHRQKAVGKDISWKQLELQDDWSEYSPKEVRRFFEI